MMTKYLRLFVHFVDNMNTRIAQSMKYAVIVLVGIFIYEAIARNGFNKPEIWVFELTTFIVAAYFVLGGAYSVLSGAQVRMDVLYGKWSPQKKALVDVITFAAFPIYFGVLFWTGRWHTMRAFIFNEVSGTTWGPILWPIKAIITVGCILMILQAISILIKDIYTARGRTLE